MYLKKTCSSPAGNTASHLKQATLPLCVRRGDSIVTILYVAPQLGQLNGIDSTLFMGDGKEAGIKRNKCPRERLIMLARAVTQHAKDLPPKHGLCLLI
jgi:hypothetical protein